MKIKDFVKSYNEIATENLKERYIKDNLKITSYIPFVKKITLAEKLVDVSTYKFEDYTKDDGTIGRRKTDTIHVNSAVQYLLFCRAIIENYTNLEVETEGFFEEYDLLKSSGLLDKLMVGNENTTPLLPMDEMSEFRMILDMKQKDAIFNATEIHNFVTAQIERFSDLADVLLKPVMNMVAERLQDNESIANIESDEQNFLEVVK